MYNNPFSILIMTVMMLHTELRHSIFKEHYKRKSLYKKQVQKREFIDAYA